jgi:excinuclease UvrABC helicase subunit UvrB
MSRHATIAQASRPEKFDVHTPGAPLVVEQIIRPTGLLDPKITLKPLKVASERRSACLSPR